LRDKKNLLKELRFINNQGNEKIQDACIITAGSALIVADLHDNLINL
jgi:hypothetical protein